ncbi:hypothetical protein SLEP1_g56364 [Rubroshorea leprosula]|uniref:Citrate synthase n=1 Tax=Rubroshorea leprosula TaxID=152421 RepID=A0AAV5ML81_9ROSI|nr:hypothetical protein SLEP1_g56364 [Rubroshorea leprosula]
MAHDEIQITLSDDEIEKFKLLDKVDEAPFPSNKPLIQMVPQILRSCYGKEDCERYFKPTSVVIGPLNQERKTDKDSRIKRVLDVDDTLEDFSVDNDLVSIEKNDFFLLENQLPYQLLEILIDSFAEASAMEKGGAITDIDFNDHCCMPTLTLAPIFLHNTTIPLLLNLMAYELCPDFKEGCKITSHLSFLDYVIDNGEHVKELRDAGVLHNGLGTDEAVAELFNKINGILVPNLKIDSELRRDIHEYCNSNKSHFHFVFVYGNLPSESQLADWDFAVSQHSAVPQGILDIIQSMPHGTRPMGVLVSEMSALPIFQPDANPALKLCVFRGHLFQAPTIAATAYLRMAGRPPVVPSSNLCYAENFLYLLDSVVLDILFILHAEHEMNCPTAAARHLVSSGVDVYTALAGAVGALYGPLHGGANEAVLKMLSEIGTVENVPEFIEGVKNSFGHRVHKNYDPTAKVIKKLAEEVFSIVGRDPLIEVAVALEKAALSDEYFN